MPTSLPADTALAANDSKLMEEALRRARHSRFNAGLQVDAIEQAIAAELSRGTRDLHGLMRAVAQLSR